MRRNALALILAIAAVASLGLATLLGGYVVARAALGDAVTARDWVDDAPLGGACPADQAGCGALGRDRILGGPRSGRIEDLQDAEMAFEAYIQRLGYEGLHLKEVMAFERNDYAIVAEDDTGIGAMELLLDRRTGLVTPEQGPNMMWNAKYGTHRGGMMGRSRGSGRMTLSPEEAVAQTQRWLDANLPGRQAGEPDAFYGYYTLHFLKDGQVEGMLSVNGDTGQIWYHNWHGEFLGMTEHAD